jgi:hypothetical protein
MTAFQINCGGRGTKDKKGGYGGTGGTNLTQFLAD